MSSVITSPKVLWLQVWGLAAVQGAIALTWVIYNLYLLKLLTQFGFPKELATGVLILENILAAVMEPLIGSLSDQAQRWIGTRFPFISVGVVLASALFIAIPAFVAFGSPTSAIRWVLPVLMVAWALAMTVFRSPALSLLGRYAFGTNLPQAARYPDSCRRSSWGNGAFSQSIYSQLRANSYLFYRVICNAGCRCCLEVSES